MSREDPQLRIRLPIELKEKIQELANKNNRSMNAEILHRLEKSFENNNIIEDLNIVLSRYQKRLESAEREIYFRMKADQAQDKK